MLENLSNDMNSKLSIDNDKLFKDCPFTNESESIIASIIEKLISLTITGSINNIIEKKIPLYCFDVLKSSIDKVIGISLLKRDYDDMKETNLLVKKGLIKSQKNLNTNYKICLSPKPKNIKLSKSVIIRGYQFADFLNPNISLSYSIDTNIFLPKKERLMLKKQKPPEDKIVMLVLKRNQNFNNDRNSKLSDNNIKIDNIIKNEHSFNSISNIGKNDITPFNIKGIEKIQKQIGRAHV